MVVKKRLDYEFNGYEIPVVPRAPRSVRRRGPFKKSVDDQQMCAFELLAAVAGKLLQESESSTSSNATETKMQSDLNVDGIKHERIESAFLPDVIAGDHCLKSPLKDHPHAESDSSLEHTSIVTSSGISKNIDCDLKLGTCNDINIDCNILHSNDRVSHTLEDISSGKLESGLERQVGYQMKQTGDLTIANSGSVKNQMEKCINSKPLINSDSSVQLSLYRDPVPSACFLKHRNHVNVGIRDDDENSFLRNKFSSKIRAFRLQTRHNYRKIRKMLTSKYWKSAPRLRDYEVLNNSEGMRSFYRNRKIMHARERNLHEAPSKRRKLGEQSFFVAYDDEASSESISNLPEKGEYGRSDAFLHRANGVLSPVKINQKSRNSSVKFSIKSFKVPELYIEVPETATVGSLKRTVMETVTAILGGGLRVGVVLQGKKVRDDNRTLQQAGISRGGNLDSLGFVLEPSFTEVNEPPKDSSPQLPPEAEQKLQGTTATPVIDSGPSNATFDSPPIIKTNKQHGLNSEIALSPRTPTNVITDEAAADSKALVPLPTINAEALALVPMNAKIKCPEASQRRTRRPFSVGEVDALVEAVEILGTGRWRDVKMRAFDNADHRTYVDLKDKWKTLVHTASISPQQRRGEPVPQELLDRVLSAHSYWSQHQSKQHGKPHPEPVQTLDAQAEKIEV